MWTVRRLASGMSKATKPPEDERMAIIEDTAELRIRKPIILAPECQTDTFKSRFSFDDLLKSAPALVKKEVVEVLNVLNGLVNDEDQENRS